MTTNYHTAISVGAAANAATFNTPLGALDEAITNAQSGVYNVLEYGAVGDGTTDDSTAIQAAIDAAEAANAVVYLPALSYKIATGLTVTCDLRAEAATLLTYTGTGVAVTVGATTGTTIYKRVELPQIAKSAAEWPASEDGETASVGVKVLNCYYCHITAPRVQYFWRGVWVTGSNSMGSQSNSITLGYIQDNKQGVVLYPSDTTGWCNNNQFFGGIVTCSDTWGTDVSGVYHIYIANNTEISNGNAFFGTDVEGEAAQYLLHCSGQANTFINCRWEASPPLIYWGTNAIGNLILHGYNAHAIQATDSVSAPVPYANHIYSRQYSRINGEGTSPVISVSNQSGNGSPSIGVFPTSSAWGVGDWTVMLCAAGIEVKDATYDYPYLEMNASNGRLLFGSGGEEPTAALSYHSANTVTAVDGDHIRVQGTWDGGHLLIGAYHLWVDGSGKLRIVSGAPANDTDGAIVGTQS